MKGLISAGFWSSLFFVVLSLLFDWQCRKLREENASEARSTFLKGYIIIILLGFIFWGIYVVSFRNSHGFSVCAGEFENDYSESEKSKSIALFEKDRGTFIAYLAKFYVILWTFMATCCVCSLCYLLKVYKDF